LLRHFAHRNRYPGVDLFGIEANGGMAGSEKSTVSGCWPTNNTRVM
jgi:hypothetical protein